VARGEGPRGYLPPEPTHPNYGYLTPEEVAQLEAQEREEPPPERQPVSPPMPEPPVEPEAEPEALVEPEVESSWVPDPPAKPWHPEPVVETEAPRHRTRADATAYTWRAENGDLYAWDGQRWMLQAPVEPAWDGSTEEHYVWNGQDWALTHAGPAVPQQHQGGPQAEDGPRGEQVDGRQGPEGQTYVWDPGREQWVPRG